MISQNILRLGYDPTNQTGITGADLASMITTAQAANDKGLVIITTDVNGIPDVPNVAINPSLARCAWVRLSPITKIASLYIWNPATLESLVYSDGTSNFVQSNWNQSALGAIGNKAIQTAMIADEAVGPGQISSVDMSQVNGLSSSFAGLISTSTPASGDISGTFANGFTIGNSVITNGKIAIGTILGTNIAAKTITIDRLSDSAIPAGYVLASGGAGAGINGVAPSTLSKLAQWIYNIYSTQESFNAAVATVMASDTTAGLTTAQTKSNIGNKSITPTSLVSYIKVTATVPVSPSNGSVIWVGLYDNTNAAFVAWARYYTAAGVATTSGQVNLSYLSAITGNLATRTYSLYYGTTSSLGTIYLNRFSEGMTLELQELQ